MGARPPLVTDSDRRRTRRPARVGLGGGRNRDAGAEPGLRFRPTVPGRANGHGNADFPTFKFRRKSGDLHGDTQAARRPAVTVARPRPRRAAAP